MRFLDVAVMIIPYSAASSRNTAACRDEKVSKENQKKTWSDETPGQYGCTAKTSDTEPAD